MPTKQAEVKDKSSFFHLMKKKPSKVLKFSNEILNEMINTDIIMQFLSMKNIVNKIYSFHYIHTYTFVYLVLYHFAQYIIDFTGSL